MPNLKKQGSESGKLDGCRFKTSKGSVLVLYLSDPPPPCHMTGVFRRVLSDKKNHLGHQGDGWCSPQQSSSIHRHQRRTVLCTWTLCHTALCARWEIGGGRAGSSDVEHLHAVLLCLCVLGWVCVRQGRGQSFLVLQTGLHQRRLLQSQLFAGVGAVLDVYDPVVRLESPPQLDVDLTLHVHEHQAPREADGHHHQLGPERPLEDPWAKGREEGQKKKKK